MRIKTNVKAGGLNLNHNQAVKGLRVKTRLKAGGFNLNHSHTVIGRTDRDAAQARCGASAQ